MIQQKRKKRRNICKNRKKRNNSNNNFTSSPPMSNGNAVTYLLPPVGQRENEKKLARLSVLFPVFFSGLFTSVEAYTALVIGKEPFTVVNWDWNTIVGSWNTIAGIINGHFIASLIVSACFALLQQYFLFIPAGLDDNKSIGLLMATVLYIVYYVMYLSQSKPPTLGNIFPVLSIIYFFIIWFSLKNDVKQVITRPFVGSK